MNNISEPKISIKPFTLTLGERFHAMQDFYARSPAYKRDKVVGSILLVLAILSFNFKGIGFPSVTFTVIGLFLLSQMSPVSMYIVWQDHLRNRHLDRECSVTVDENLFTLKSKNMESDIKWSAFQNLFESKVFFFLVLGNGNYITIPKRGFSSPEETAVFYSFLLSKIRKPGGILNSVT